MKPILLLFLFAFSIWGADSFRNLGEIRVQNSLAWDAGGPETNVAGFYIYVANTNSTNFSRVGTATTNRWSGSTITNLHGLKILYLTAFDTAGVESDPSEKVFVNFRLGLPFAPTKIRIYTVIAAAATNSLMSAETVSPALPSIPP